MKRRRLLGHIIFAGAFALIPPAIAESANVAMATNTSSDNIMRPSIVSNEVVGMDAAGPDDAIIATHAPVRLSPLAGNDSIAWDNAHSVHAWHRHPVK